MRLTYALMIVFLSVVAIGVGNIVYTQHVQQTADERWCTLLTTLDTNNPPARTPHAIKVQQQIHQLRRDLGCL